MASDDRPNEALAYLITFRCYATWLHGDPRGSMNDWHNRFGEPPLSPRPALEAAERRALTGMVQGLDRHRRVVVGRAIEAECEYRGWILRALAVRTNHVHVVLAAQRETPERVMMFMKKQATKALRRACLAAPDERIWSGHGSTLYLWRERDVDDACRYVVEGQGPDLA